MLSTYLIRFRRAALSGLGFAIIASMSWPAAAAPSLTETSMTKAISFFGVLTGRDLSTDDAAWLKEHWAEAFETAPQSTAAEVDDLALAFERYQRDGDRLALAQSRATVLTNIHCTAAQTSDPEVRRLREILTPAGDILAADCLLGLVVTKFDVDGRIASHAMLADIAEQPHDPEKDRDELLAAIETDFADASPADKAVLASGELRHAMLQRYWSRLEGDPKKSAFISEVRGMELGDFRLPARQFEGLALSDLGAIDYLAKAGNAKLTSSAIDEYREWLERIAGQSFDSRDLDWMQQAILKEFQATPEKTLGEVAGIEEMNRDYILADTGEQKRAMVDSWAAAVYCYASTSDNPDERRLIEIVFRHDPVVDADCQAKRVTRKRHQVIAEADGAQLLEQDLDLGFRFTRMILARPLLPEEEAIVREDSIQSFSKDPAAWRERYEQYRALLADIENYDTDFFLGMNNRKKLFDPIYCGLITSDEPYAGDYLAMFRRNGAIVHEDCANQMVTTKDEIDAFIGFSNFLALLNGRPPFNEAETEEIRRSVATLNLDKIESTMLAIKEWWSLLSLDEKIAEAKSVREQGVTPEGDASTVDFFVKMVQIDVVNRNSKMKACLVEQEMIRGRTALFAARSGGYVMNDLPGGELGYSDSDLANIVHANTLYAGLCG